MNTKIYVALQYLTKNNNTESGISISIALNKREKLIARLEISPLDFPSANLVSSLAISIAIGVVSNLFRSDEKISTIEIYPDFPFHPGWKEIAGVHNEISTNVLEIFGETNPKISSRIIFGDVFLVSGGKDTLYMLEQHQTSSEEDLIVPGIYLGRGSEINWREEIKAVFNYSDQFNINLFHFELNQFYISSKGALRFGNRASWRELVTISLASQYGNLVHTGINTDSISRLENLSPNLTDHLSQMLPVLCILENILKINIETVPGEFEVYQNIRDHRLFDSAGSCTRPDCSDEHPCSKHKGFDIYDRVLEGKSLRDEDIEFVNGPYYIGDSKFINYQQ